MVENSPHKRTGASGGMRFDGATWDVDTAPRMSGVSVQSVCGAHHLADTLRHIHFIEFLERGNG